MTNVLTHYSNFLSKMDKLVECPWFPVEATPILDFLSSLWDIKKKCFSWDLKDGWEEAISVYSSHCAELQIYAEMVFKLELTVMWKIHILACHFSHSFPR